MKYSFKFLKIGKIAGIHYTVNEKRDTIVIYGIGAPVSPDYGCLPDARILLNSGVDIFVPDYLGYGRSDGVFTPMNCIKTFLLIFDAFKKGCMAKNYYENSETKLKYKDIIFIGKSFGGTYIPLLPRFNNKIKKLAVFCPCVESKSCGSIKGEESNKDFLNSMKFDGYHHLYRGILNNTWQSHLENKDDLSPMDNIKYLKDVKLFIGHGKKDKCIHYSKSVKYYQQIIDQFPNNKKSFLLKIYPFGDHGNSTTNKATKDFMVWLKK